VTVERQIFRVGLTADFGTRGQGLLDAAVAEMLAPVADIVCELMPDTAGVATAAVLDEYDAVVALDYRFPAACFAGLRRLKLIARWGAGYDSVDTRAASAAGVFVAITPDSVSRAVAEGIVALLFALAKGLPALDRNCRAGRWWQDPPRNINVGGRVLGSVGAGNIATEMFRMARALGFGRLLAYSRRKRMPEAAALGVELVELETVMRESDFVTINCPLTDETRGLIGARELAWMRPQAYLINTARGAVVEEAALLEVLRAGRIAGAGLDVFAEEPMAAGHPLAGLDNVILTAHRIAKSEECSRDTSLSACRSVLAVYRGEAPRYIANPDVLDHPRVKARLSGAAHG
jgi:phosphoglycerate dehydrogenase-like enzyme